MHGFFHADPHAGNLSIDESGKIIIYDFGMMGEITPVQIEAIAGCIAAVVKRDTQELIKHLTTLGMVKVDAKIGPLTRSLEPMLNYYSGSQLRDLDLSVLEYDIDQILIDKALLMPPNLAYLIRAGTTLEGIARTLVPNFSFVEASKPALRKWVLSRPSTASSLLKVFFNGNMSKSDDRLFKSTPGKMSEIDLASKRLKTKNESPSSGNEVNSVAINADEIDELKAKVYLLETQAKSESQKRILAAWLVVSVAIGNIVFMSLANNRESSSYAYYFWIGNGVMGAIIIWQLVAPDSLARRSKKSGQSREHGDRRC